MAKAPKLDLLTVRKEGAKLNLDAERADALEQRKRQPTAPLAEIKPRVAGDTRPLQLTHVVALAESFAVVGLLQPIVVDRNLCLLAGGHRLAAVTFLGVAAERVPASQLESMSFSTATEADLATAVAGITERLGLEMLQETWSSRFAGGVPVRQLAHDSAQADEVELAQVIETMENTQRVNYSKAQVVDLATKFMARGFTDTVGRPKVGEKKLMPALSVIMGMSYNTVRRHLGRLESPTASPGAVRTRGMTVDAVLAWLEACSDRTVIDRVVAAAERARERTAPAAAVGN